MKATKKQVRQAYLTLNQAIHTKPLEKTPRKLIADIDNKAYWIRNLQDLAVYLGVVQ